MHSKLKKRRIDKSLCPLVQLAHKDMKQIHIYVDEKTYEELRIILLKRQETVSAWVRRLMEIFIKKQNAPN